MSLGLAERVIAQATGSLPQLDLWIFRLDTLLVIPLKQFIASKPKWTDWPSH
jgi:hypothetical protein